MFSSRRSSIHIAFLLAILAASPQLAAAVSGTVIDPDGNPIEGALVQAIDADDGLSQKLRWTSADPDPTVLAETETDSKGQYTLDIDRSRTAVEVEITKDGAFPIRMSVPHDEWVGATVLRDAELAGGRVVSGSTPVAGALVILTNANDVEIRTRTDEKGSFVIPRSNSRFDSLVVLHPDHAPFTRRFGAEEDMTIRLSKGIALSARVVGPDGETPVEGATVTIDGWPVARSDHNGGFIVEHAPADWSEARVFKDDLVAAVRRTTARSTTLRLTRAATLSGSVIDSDSGRGVPMVRISILGEGMFGDTVASTVSDTSGRFTFPGVLPGSYNLAASHPSWVSEPEAVTITGKSRTSKTIRIRPAATIRGNVRDERGDPVAAASVRTAVDRPGGGFRFMRFGMRESHPARSDPNGRFVLFGVDPEAPLHLEGSHRRYPDARTDRFAVNPGETTTGKTIVFPQGSSLAGVVTSESGDPVSGASVRATRSERSGAMGRRMIMIGAPGQASDPVTTDARGRFELQLEDGKWDLVVDADGFASERMNAIEVPTSNDPLEVVLEEGVVVQGRVVRSGTGVPDVMIAVLSADRQPEPITTGPDGSFTIDDLPRGKVTVVATKPDAFIQEMRAIDAPSRDLVIEVPSGGTIRGRVVDASSNDPITSFQAGPSPERGGGGMRIRMPGSLVSFHDEDGLFVIENVPPGRVELIVEAPGYVEKRLSGIEVEDGGTVDDLVVELSSGVRVTGTVRGPEGGPLGGVTVSIESDEEDPIAQILPRLMADATTDSSGQYVIAAATPGEVTISFRRDGYVTTRKSVELSGKESTVDATLRAGRTVRGTVTTSSGAPIRGATVRAVSAAQSSGRSFAESDANGQFTIEGLADGRYSFIASHADYVMAEESDVDISTVQTVNLVMGQGGTITGRILGADPQTYSSITVMARSGGSYATSSVSPDGAFRVEGVTPGTVNVSARMSQMFENRTTPSVSVEVTSGSQSSVDLEFTGGASVSGTVTRFGEPLRSGIVRFTPRDRSNAGSMSNLDNEGRYTIDGLSPGSYDVTVIDLQTFSPFSKTVDIRSDNETVDIDIRGGRIEGLVTDATSSQPIDGASIVLERTDAEQGGRFSRLGATTGSTGEFVIEPVPEGSYRLRVERAGFGHATRDVFVTEGREESVELALQPNEGIALRVVDSRDGRALTADVTAWDVQNQVAWQGRPSPRADGSIRIPVAPGTYRVSVSANGYAPSSAQLSSPGPTQTIALSVGGTLVIESRSGERRRLRLLDPYGQPVGTSRWNRTGETWLDPGSNRIDNLSPGQYTIQILGPDGTPQTAQPVAIREGETTTITL